jgi:E3 ubiquitin-protein ligase HECTD2
MVTLLIYFLGIKRFFVSELKYPHNVSRFRCPVCDTVNDLKPHVRQQLSNQPLTLRLLKKSVNECKMKERARKSKGLDDKEREKIYEPVEKLIEMIFSSWVCLNHSFSNVKEYNRCITSNSKAKVNITILQGEPTSIENSGLEMNDIKDAYRIILNLV